MTCAMEALCSHVFNYECGKTDENLLTVYISSFREFIEVVDFIFIGVFESITSIARVNVYMYSVRLWGRRIAG